jgi:hypothetical protein
VEGIRVFTVFSDDNSHHGEPGGAYRLGDFAS